MRDLHPTFQQRPGMQYRTSTRWFDSGSSVRKTHHIPYVSISGKFSIHTLYIWKAFPEQVLFSMISTVYSRLLRISLKRNIKLTRRHRNDLVKVATVYTITKDDWVIDRFLGICKESVKKATGFVHFCVFNLDDDKRFVYSQAWQHAHWLKFQAYGPSDKSSKRINGGTHLRNFCEASDLYMWKTVSFKELVNFWEVHPFCGVAEDEAHLTLESDLELSSVQSEPSMSYDDSEYDSD
jgi:hypothetical protein